MTLDQALYEMELVGHDFYLFVDKESEKPSVVYRRRGYDYGVISLDIARTATTSRDSAVARRTTKGWSDRVQTRWSLCHDARRDQ